MTEQDFLQTLRSSLRGLSAEEIQRSADYYSEMIADRMEAGMTEEEAVAALGNPREIARQILLDMPLPKVIRSRFSGKRVRKVWEILFLILGSPIWLSLLLAAAAVVFCIYVVFWAMLVVFWAVDVSFFGVFVGMCIVFAVNLMKDPISAFLCLGLALFCAGLGLLGFFACKKLSIFWVKLTVKFTRGIKSLFIRKENSNEIVH